MEGTVAEETVVEGPLIKRPAKKTAVELTVNKNLEVDEIIFTWSEVEDQR